MLHRTLLFSAALAAVTIAPAEAQFVDPQDNVVDRVVAIVGDSTILLTQVQEEAQRLQLQGVAVPEDPAEVEEFLRGILDTWVSRVLVLQAASRDSLIQVDEAQIDERVNQEIDQRTQQFGSSPAFQEALQAEGLTLAAYREMIRSQIRQEQIQQMFMQLRLREAAPVEVSEAEMLEAFQAARSQMGQRPRLLSFDQVVVAPSPSEEATALARARADSLLAEINAGADFEALASEHSDDRGSAAVGGDLGWFRRGAMVRPFEEAAFALFDGQVSGVVETEFGFHIIKVERSRPGERNGRHILIMPSVGEGDIQRSREQAEEVKALAESGSDMSDLWERYSDPEAPDSLTVPFQDLSRLPLGYATALRSAQAGTVYGPIEYQNARGETRIAIIKVREVREAGAYTFEEVRPQLAQQLQQNKQLQLIIDELREGAYVEILF
jgi:peptidyl-prolyl cis-trans isomerase SurA